MMKLILADDHVIVRQGFRSLLESKGQYRVIGEASNGREAVKLAEEMHPDAVVTEIVMPELNGLEAARLIRERLPQVKVIVLSMHISRAYLKRAFQAGACAYILKNADFQELRLALEASKKEEFYVGTGVSRLLVEEYLRLLSLTRSTDTLDLLTPREREILQLLSEGHNRQKISRTLSISPKTVDRHKENLKLKLDLEQDSDFIALARELGVILGEGDSFGQ